MTDLLDTLLTFEGVSRLLLPPRKPRLYRLFEFVNEDCNLCHKAPAEIDGLCIGCDHLQDDLRIDQSRGEPFHEA